MSTICYFCTVIFICMCNILYSQQDCQSNRKYWTGYRIACEPDCKEVFRADDNITCINITINKKKNDFDVGVYINDVRRIKFIDSTLTFFPAGICSDFWNTLEIYLNNNKIEELENKAFERNTELLHLYLQDNYISIINKELFNDLVSLRTLNMCNNTIEELEDEVFSNLLNLTELNISYNKLLRLSKRLLNNNQYLETLFLNNNNIMNIDENLFANLKKLKYLHLNNNKITNISATVFKYNVNLKELFLNSNNISNIHIDLFDNLNNLEVLCLQNNNLTYIPMGSFGYLHNLEKLNLSYNYLSSIDNAFANLEKLRVLDLANNKIINIHVSEFYFLHNIMQINLDNNFLSSLDIQDLITHHYGKHSSIIISLNNNSWKCDWLLNALLLLQKNNFVVSKGSSFKVKNVKGISCLNDKETYNSTSTEIAPIRTTNTNTKETSVTYEVFTVSNIISSSQTNIALTSELSHTNKESIINSVTEETSPINNATNLSTSTNDYGKSTSEEDFTNSEGLQQHYKGSESEEDKLNELLKNSKEFRFIIIFILVIMLISVLLTLYKEFIKQKFNTNAESNSRSCVLELINHSEQ